MWGEDRSCAGKRGGDVAPGRASAVAIRKIKVARAAVVTERADACGRQRGGKA